MATTISPSDCMWLKIDLINSSSYNMDSSVYLCGHMPLVLPTFIQPTKCKQHSKYSNLLNRGGLFDFMELEGVNS